MDFSVRSVYNGHIKKKGADSNMENAKEILFLQPCMKDVVWGGKKLRDEFG